MHRRFTLFGVVVACWASSAACDALAVGIEITRPSAVYSTASDGLHARSDESSEVTSVPASATVTAIDGASHSTSTYTLSGDGLHLTFDHVRDMPHDSYGGTFLFLAFSPGTDLNYSFSGAYSSDVDGGRTTLIAHLYVAAGRTLYESFQDSFATPEESFILGQSEGDTTNILIGSPTGRLRAGREYGLQITAQIWAQENAATAIAHSSGYVTMSFAPVPEPSTAMLLATGILGLAAAQRRSR